MSGSGRVRRKIVDLAVCGFVLLEIRCSRFGRLMKIRSLRKPPTPAQRQYWEQLKARGKKRFVLRVGVMRWGGSMFVLMTALDLIRKTTRQRTAIDYVFEIALSLLVWPLAGYVCGLLTWSALEKKFSGVGESTN